MSGRRDRYDDTRDDDDWPVPGSRPPGRSGVSVLLIALIGVGALAVLVVVAAAGLFFLRAGPAAPPPVAQPVPAGGPIAMDGPMARGGPAKGMAPVFPPKKGAAPPLGQVLFSLNADEFAREFTKDRAAFEKKYGGQVVELAGPVEDVGEDFLRRGSVTLTGDPTAPIGSVLCQVPGGAPWNRVLPGQTARIRGRCPAGRLTRPMMNGCELQAVEGDPPPTVTAAALAREVATDRPAAAKKWNSKFLIVVGPVKEVVVRPPPAAAGPTVVLASDPATLRVELVFSSDHQYRVEQARAGDEVRVLARCNGLTGDKDRVVLAARCVLDR